MAFRDIKFPEDIGLGSSGGAGWNTKYIAKRDGGTERLARQEEPIHEYSVTSGARTFAQLFAIKRHAMLTKGGLFSFPYKDWSHYATTATGAIHRKGDAAVDDEDMPLGIGDGSTEVFQAQVTYTDGVFETVETIRYIELDTDVVAIDGAAQTRGVDYTVNLLTGEFTFTTAPLSAEVITFGCEFCRIVNYDEPTDKLLRADQRAFDNGTIGQILLRQEPSNTAVEESCPTGSTKNHVGITANLTISQSEGRMHRLEVSAASLWVRVPRADSIPGDGAFVFKLANVGTQSIAVQNNDGVLITNLATASAVDLHIFTDTGGVKQYLAAA